MNALIKQAKSKILFSDVSNQLPTQPQAQAERTRTRSAHQLPIKGANPGAAVMLTGGGGVIGASAQHKLHHTVVRFLPCWIKTCCSMNNHVLEEYKFE